jgi:hypothetical protein
MPLPPLPGPLPAAHLAHPGAGFRTIGIAVIIRVTLGAMCLPGIAGIERLATQKVLARSHCLQVPRIGASPVPAKVISHFAVVYEPSEVLIDDAVNPNLSALQPGVAVAAMCIARPLPATVFPDYEPEKDVANGGLLVSVPCHRCSRGRDWLLGAGLPAWPPARLQAPSRP